MILNFIDLENATMHVGEGEAVAFIYSIKAWQGNWISDNNRPTLEFTSEQLNFENI